MNDAYEDPFLPLPSLPDGESSRAAIPYAALSAALSATITNDERSTFQQNDDRGAYLNTHTVKDQGSFAANFDAYSLEGDFMESESDCSDESDIDFDMVPSMFEPINIFNNYKEVDNNKEIDNNKEVDTKKEVNDESNYILEPNRIQEDSLSALPVISSTSSVKGYTEHVTSLSATSHTSGGTGDDAAAGSNTGYDYYSRPLSYNLKRPSYAMENKIWDTQSVHSFHSAHSATSTRSAPILSMQRPHSLNSARFQNQKPEVSENHTACARTVSSSCNEGGIDSLETYSFYSRPPQNYTFKRPAYAQETAAENSYLSQYRVESPFSAGETAYEPTPETSQSGEANTNQKPDQSISSILNMSEHSYKKIKRRSSMSHANTEYRPEHNVDNVSCKSMPATIPSIKVTLALGSPFSQSSADNLKDDTNMRSATPDESPKMREDMEDTTGTTGEDEPPEIEWQEKEESTKLVTEADRSLATGFSHAVLSEYGPTGFTESDRQGKRKGLGIGFPGISCIHCNGSTKKGGRFFPSTIKTMADTKKTLISINNHLLKCHKCPQEVKDNITNLRELHDDERKEQKYGSQKAFFSNIWKRLHG